MSDYFTSIQTAIMRGIHSIFHGTVTIIVQDGKIIQMEIVQKLRFNSDGTVVSHRTTGQTKQSLEKRIRAAFNNLQYGQVVFVVREGDVIQIERMEKKRLLNNQGMFGEGI